MKNIGLSSLAGLLLIFLGSAVAFAWIAHIPSLINLGSSNMNMVFNTAICFVIAGAGLMLPNYFPRAVEKVHIICGSLLMLIAGITLSQYIFNISLGIDQLFIKTWLSDHSPYPGRMAIDTCLSFFLAGILFTVIDHTNRWYTALFVQLSIFVIGMLGISSLLGYALKHEFMYSWYTYSRMALPTSFGIGFLALGLQSVWSSSADYDLFYRSREDKKILIICSFTLLAIALIAGITGYITSTRHAEKIIQRTFEQKTISIKNLLEYAIYSATKEINAIVNEPVVTEALANNQFISETSSEKITALKLLSSSAIQINSVNGKIIYQSGVLNHATGIRLNKIDTYQPQINWKNGFFVAIKKDIIKNGEKIGSIEAEWPINTINHFIDDTKLLLCQSNSLQIITCIPSYHKLFHPHTLFSNKSKQLELIEKFHKKQNITLTGADYASSPSIVTYLYSSALDLDIILKDNISILYQPVREQLYIVFPIIIVTILFGIFLLYWQVLPIINKMMRSKQLAIENHIKLHAIVNNAAEGILTVTPSGIIETCNQRSAQMFDCNSNELINTNIRTLIPSLTEESLYTNKSHAELFGIRKDGVTFPIEFATARIKFRNDHLIIVIMRDISERKKAEIKLLESESRFRSAFDRSPIGMAIVGLDGAWLKVNKALCNIVGYSEEELLKLDFQTITHPDDLEADLKLAKQLLDDKIAFYHMEKRYIKKDRSITWIYLTVTIIRNKNGDPLYYVSQIQDINEKKKAEQELSYRAYYDTLTGLVNRNQLEKSMNHSIASALRHQQKFSVFFLDLDNFKKINDTLGHDAGDEVLKVIGDRLKNGIRVTDIAARLGGDEFILVLNGIDSPETASNFAEKIINHVLKPIRIQNHELTITTSIGISFYPADGSDYNTLLKNADYALYRAKELGKNNYQFCTPEMNTEIHEKIKLKTSLQRALEKHEFSLSFLPKLDISSHKIIGLEALLRWQDKHYGIVSPAKIIPLAEEMGLILPLSEWILRSTCEELKKWHEAGFSAIKASINLSPHQFMQPDFVELTEHVLKETGVNPGALDVEITENLIMQSPDHSLKIISALKKMGIQVTIDNFGTGFSSLNYLYQFSADCIKIDRHFTQHITAYSQELPLLIAMIGLAKNLGIKVIAEGIENKDQYDLLIKLGCDILQGYYLCPPMPADKVIHYLKSFYTKPTLA